jgi:hypothetical protein
VNGDDKVRVDMAELTLGELSEVGEILGSDVSTALQGPQQPRAIAALVWITLRRDDPTYTLDRALGLKMSQLEIVGGPDSESSPAERSSGNSGVAPLVSLESGH